MVLIVNPVNGMLWKHIYDYNEIRFESYSYTESRKNLFTAEGTALTNLVLGIVEQSVVDSNCNKRKLSLDSTAFHAAQRYAGGNTLTSALIHSYGDFPLMLNDCVELFHYRAGSSIMKPDNRLWEFNDEDIVHFMKKAVRTDVTIKNFKLVLPTDYKRALSNNEQVYKANARKKG